MASTDLDQVLDKAWADRGLPEIPTAPAGVLNGVSDRDGELLQEASGVKTAAEPAELEYVRRAQALAALDAAT